MENYICGFLSAERSPHINVLNIEMEPRMGDRETEPMKSSENWINGKFAALVSKCRKVTTHKCPCINVLNIEMEPRMGEGNKQTNGDLSALRKPEMQICRWFNFLIFLLVQFSLSPILGSISTFKTFMCGDLSALKKTRDANFPLVQFSKLSIGSVIPFTHPRFRLNI